MKKIFTLLLTSTFGVIANAQVDRKYEASITLGVGGNANRMGTKQIDRKGVGSNLMLGFNLNINFTETIGLCTGVEFDFESFKYQTKTPTFYDYNDAEIFKKDDFFNGDVLDPNPPAKSEIFQLESRKQKPVLIMIPTMFTFRTGEIGPVRYFGKFGLRSGFVMKSTVNDKGYVHTKSLTDPSGSTKSELVENNKMKSARDLFVFRSSIGIAAGAMWNFSGTTSLVAELGYYYGLTPIHSGKTLFGSNASQDKNWSLYNTDGVNPYSATPNPNKRTYYQPKATQNQFVLKVAIIF